MTDDSTSDRTPVFRGVPTRQTTGVVAVRFTPRPPSRERVSTS